MSTIIDQFSKVPPHNLDAEAACIGSAVLDRDAWESSAALVDSHSFFSAEHGILWKVLSELHRSNVPVDVILFMDALVQRRLLDEVGGAAKLAIVLDCVPSAAHAQYYAGIVAEMAKRRAIITAANEAIRGAYAATNSATSSEDIISGLERQIAHVRDARRVDSIRRIGDIARAVLEGKRSGAVTRIRTGFRELDEVSAGGLPVGGTAMVGGKAGMGKSQLGKQIARNVGEGVGDQPPMPVGIITIEETGEKIATNYLAAVGTVVNTHIVRNRLDPKEWGRLDAANEALDTLPIFVDDAQRKLKDIQRVARRLVKKHGCRVIIVDHLHLIDGETDANREQELSQISGGLKTLWKELGVAGVELLQMNRGGDRESLPELDHLRGSGSLEADGDLILQLYRPDYFAWKNDAANFVPDHHLCVFINKNKDGPVGKVSLFFDGDHQRITDWPCRAF
jgi:replicative DNA helicase